MIVCRRDVDLPKNEAENGRRNFNFYPSYRRASVRNDRCVAVKAASNCELEL